MSTSRLRTEEEQGVALIWAIVILVIVMGLLSVISMSTLSSTRDSRNSASRTRAVFWAEAAGKDLVSRLDSAELGPWVAGRSAAGDEFLSFASVENPVGIATPTTSSFPIPGMPASDLRAIPLTSTVGGVTQRGWYQVLAPAPGARPWSGLKVRDASRPGEQGSVQFVVRAWNDARTARPVLVRLELRRSALSRFSILSEDQLTLGGIGSLQLGGAVHTNNTRGAATAIQVGAATDVSAVRSISTTSGAISGCVGGICRPDVKEVVSFGSANGAMHRITRLAAQGRCVQSRFAACSVSLPTGTVVAANSIPAWRVDLAAPNGCVDVGRTSFPVRADTGGYPMANDRVGAAAGMTGRTRYCPAPGGGAIVLDGDVVLSGMRAVGAAPVTIMARRTTSFPQARIGTTPTTVTAPASIYLEQSASNAGIGAGSADNPVGLVAQGGIYAPSWAMNSTNDVLRVANVAAMAVTGEIAYSPSIQSIAADGGTPGGLGIQPTQARALGYGWGSRFTFEGSLISGGRMVFRYGQGADFIGYDVRTFRYVGSLSWNPPPFFPADTDWHLSDWTEFDQ